MELTKTQKKIVKLFQSLEVLKAITLPKFLEIVHKPGEKKSAELLELQDCLSDIRSQIRHNNKLTIEDLETPSGDESQSLLTAVSEALSSFLPLLDRETELNLKEFLICLMDDAQTHSSNGSLDMATISTLSTIVPSVMGAAGVSTNTVLNDDLDALCQASPYQRKTINYSSTITLNQGERPTVYTSETTTTPDYLLDLKVYDLAKIAPANMGTKEMWRDAIFRMKFYGHNLTDMAMMAAARKLIDSTVKTVIARNRREESAEESRPPAKKRLKRSNN